MQFIVAFLLRVSLAVVPLKPGRLSLATSRSHAGTNATSHQQPVDPHFFYWKIPQNVNTPASATTAAGPAFGGCHPTCMWSCGSFNCDQVCEPVCAPPQCETACTPLTLAGCKVQCEAPKCAVVCPSSHCSTGNCPECSTVCAAPVCKTVCGNKCESKCRDPQCTWQCKKPEQCAEPKCSMKCSSPASCDLADPATLTPPSFGNGLSVVSHGLAGLDPNALTAGAPAPAAR